MFLIRETIPDDLAVRVSPYGGAPARWAEDESQVDNVISDLVLSDEMPGGCKEASGVLARNPHLAWPDLDAYADVSVYSPGVEEVWAGRLDKAPDSSGDHMSISPAAVGWQFALEDNKAAKLGIIDCQLDSWKGPSAAYKIFRLTPAGGPYNYFDPPLAVPDNTTGYPSLHVSLTGEWTGNWAMCDAFYDAGVGLKIGNIYYGYYQSTPPGGFAAPWVLEVALMDNDMEANKTVYGGNIAPAGVTRYMDPTIARRWAGIKLYYAGVGGQEGFEYIAGFRSVTVYGDQNLPRQGPDPGGFYAKDILAYAIPRLAPPLTVRTDELEDDGYIVRQAWWRDPTTMKLILESLMRTSLYDWFVFGGKQFQVRKPGTYGRRWKTTIREGQLSELGLDASRLWESIVVSYQDVDGSTRTVGPPASGADVEDAGLQIIDPDHPAVRAPITRRDMLSMQGVGVSGAAIAVGKQFLGEANLLNRSGSATLSHYVMDEYGTPRPASQVKSGDWVSVTDASDTSYRKIVQKGYRHSERGASVDLDAPPEGLQALLEPLQADLVPLGLAN